MGKSFCARVALSTATFASRASSVSERKRPLRISSWCSCWYSGWVPTISTSVRTRPTLTGLRMMRPGMMPVTAGMVSLISRMSR